MEDMLVPSLRTSMSLLPPGYSYEPMTLTESLSGRTALDLLVTNPTNG